MIKGKVKDNISSKIASYAQTLSFKQPLRESAELLQKESVDNVNKQGAIYQGGGFVRAGGVFYNGGKATTSGKVWKPLAQSTRRDRASKGFSPARPILVRTGKLKRGFRSKVTSDKTAEVTNIVSYAKYHQNGTSRMPQRKILGLSRKSGLAIKLIFVNYIKRKNRKL